MFGRLDVAPVAPLAIEPSSPEDSLVNLGGGMMVAVAVAAVTAAVMVVVVCAMVVVVVVTVVAAHAWDGRISHENAVVPSVQRFPCLSRQRNFLAPQTLLATHAGLCCVALCSALRLASAQCPRYVHLRHKKMPR